MPKKRTPSPRVFLCPQTRGGAAVTSAPGVPAGGKDNAVVCHSSATCSKNQKKEFRKASYGFVSSDAGRASVVKGGAVRPRRWEDNAVFWHSSAAKRLSFRAVGGRSVSKKRRRRRRRRRRVQTKNQKPKTKNQKPKKKRTHQPFRPRRPVDLQLRLVLVVLGDAVRHGQQHAGEAAGGPRAD